MGVALDVDNRSVAEKCLQAGLLVLTAKEKLRLLPPLNITIEEIKSGLEILEKVLKTSNNKEAAITALLFSKESYF